MELQQQRAASALEPFDAVELPQRPVLVESLHRNRRGQVEEIAEAPGAGRAQLALVIGEVEVRIDLPARRRRAERVEHDVLPQAGHLDERALERLAEARPSGGPSSSITERIVERSMGSRSLFHISASLAPMRSV